MKRRILAFLLACLLALPLVACGSSSTEEDNDSNFYQNDVDTEETVNGLSFVVPASISYHMTDDSVSVFLESGTCRINTSDIADYSEDTVDSLMETMLNANIKSYGGTVDKIYNVTIGDEISANVALSIGTVGDTLGVVQAYSFASSETEYMYHVTYFHDSTDGTDSDDFDDLLDTFSFETSSEEM